MRSVLSAHWQARVAVIHLLPSWLLARAPRTVVWSSVRVAWPFEFVALLSSAWEGEGRSREAMLCNRSCSWRASTAAGSAESADSFLRHHAGLDGGNGLEDAHAAQRGPFRRRPRGIEPALGTSSAGLDVAKRCCSLCALRRAQLRDRDAVLRDRGAELGEEH